MHTRLHTLIPASRTVLILPNGAMFQSTGGAPYTAFAVDNVTRAAARLDRMLTTAGGARSVTAAVVVPSSPPRVTERWAAVVSRMTFPAVVVSRPSVAVSGLGLESGSPRMVIDRHVDGTEISVVTNDGMVGGVRCEARAVNEVAEAAEALLRQVDPDVEWAIRQEGVCVLTDDEHGDWTRALARALKVTVELVDDPIRLIHAGVSSDRALIERCLHSADVRPRLRRASLRPSARTSPRSGPAPGDSPGSRLFGSGPNSPQQRRQERPLGGLEQRDEMLVEVGEMNPGGFHEQVRSVGGQLHPGNPTIHLVGKSLHQPDVDQSVDESHRSTGAQE